MRILKQTPLEEAMTREAAMQLDALPSQAAPNTEPTTPSGLTRNTRLWAQRNQRRQTPAILSKGRPVNQFSTEGG